MEQRSQACFLTSTRSLLTMLALIASRQRARTPMASITIRNLDESIKARLRVRAAHHKRSMEDEARKILGAALAEEPAHGRNLADAIHKRFRELGGVDLRPPPREAIRPPPRPGQ